MTHKSLVAGLAMAAGPTKAMARANPEPTLETLALFSPHLDKTAHRFAARAGTQCAKHASGL